MIRKWTRQLPILFSQWHSEPAGRRMFPQGHEWAPPLVVRKAFGQVIPQNNVPSR